MADEIKDLEGKKLDDAELEESAGGFVGSDKYTREQYSFAGVTWQHNTFSKDEYYVRGVKISQDTAEKITDKALLVGRPLTDDELSLLFGIRV